MTSRQKRLIADRARRLERLLVRQAEVAAELTRINRRIADLDAWLDGMTGTGKQTGKRPRDAGNDEG